MNSLTFRQIQCLWRKKIHWIDRVVSHVFYLGGRFSCLTFIMCLICFNGSYDLGGDRGVPPHPTSLKKGAAWNKPCYLNYMPKVFFFLPNEVITSMVHLASYLPGTLTSNLKLLCQCQKSRATRKWYFHCQQVEINLYTAMVWERLCDKAHIIYYSTFFLKWQRLDLPGKKNKTKQTILLDT